MITPENLPNHELIGLHAEVVEASNETQTGIEGRVVDETMKTLTIETRDGERAVPKKGSVFRFTTPDGEKVRVDGNVIAYRPEDRVKKRHRKW